MDIKKRIYDHKIIGIIRGIKEDRIIETIESLINGGISLIEITLNQDSDDKCLETIKLISLISKTFADKICLGAGTVITEKQVEMVIDAGAEYIVSPNTDIDVIKKTKALNKISIPGAYTPSEIVWAYNSGADFVKIFPAASLGPGYVRSVLSPLSNIPLLAVGGVNITNANEFLAAGAVGLGVGGNLIDKQAVNMGRFDILTQNAKEFRKKVMQVGEV